MLINQVVILVGGLGTRLRSLTKTTPKPLIKINDTPFIEYLIKFYSISGFKKIVLLTKYKSSIFAKKYHGKVIDNIKITCINDKQFLGTAGSLLNSIKILDKHFIFCNGDTFFDIKIKNFVKKFKKNYIGILACSKIQPHNKRYTSFFKKKKLISSGIYLFNRDKIQKYLIKIGSLENEVINQLPKNKFKKISYKKKFIDIGTPADLIKAKNILKTVNRKKCVFLDRDGVINYDYGYVYKKENFKFKKGVYKAIKLLNDNNFLVIVVTNQSGIGRGFYTKKDVENLHIWVSRKLQLYNAKIDKFYYSPYFKKAKRKIFRKGLIYRKPNIGLFNTAMKEFNIKKEDSFFIGDKFSDRLAAKKIGIKYFNVNKKTNLLNLIKRKIIF